MVMEQTVHDFQRRFLKRSKLYRKCCDHFREKGGATLANSSGDNFPSEFSSVQKAYAFFGDIFNGNERNLHDIVYGLMPEGEDTVCDAADIVLGMFDAVIRDLERGLKRRLEEEGIEQMIIDSTLRNDSLLRNNSALRGNLEYLLKNNPFFSFKAIDLRTKKKWVKLNVSHDKVEVPGMWRSTLAMIGFNNTRWGSGNLRAGDFENYLNAYDAVSEHGKDWKKSAEKLGIYNDRQDDRHIHDKLREWHNKAVTLIENAEKFDFPGGYQISKSKGARKNTGF